MGGKKKTKGGIEWSRFAWSAVKAGEAAFGEVDDAACFGLEELPAGALEVYQTTGEFNTRHPGEAEEEEEPPFTEDDAVDEDVDDDVDDGPRPDGAADDAAAAAEAPTPEAAAEDPPAEEVKKKKTKKKRKKEAAAVEEEYDEAMASEWCKAADGWFSTRRLDARLVAALKRCGFAAPTPCQRLVVPLAVVRGRDVLCAAETGSGKTLAFGLPVLDDVFQLRGADVYAMATENKGELRSLVLAPTRELVVQVAAHLRRLLPLRQQTGAPASKAAQATVVTALVGGLSEEKHKRLLAKFCPPVVVATPGRLQDLVKKGFFDPRPARYLCVDEADRMLEPGAFPEVKQLCESHWAAGGRWQTLIFSATLVLRAHMPRETHKKQRKRRNDGDDGRTDLATLIEPLRTTKEDAPAAAEKHEATKKANKQVIVDLTQKKKNKASYTSSSSSLSLESKDAAASKEGGDEAATSTAAAQLPERLELFACECRSQEEKLAALYAVLTVADGEEKRKMMGGAGTSLEPSERRVVVFTNAISSVRRLQRCLEALKVGRPVVVLHAMMQQRARLKALDRFRGAADGVLVATDVAARGLDVLGVRTVVHYDISPTLKAFVHRAGRTARATRAGTSISLVSAQDSPKHDAVAAAVQPRTFQRLRVQPKTFTTAMGRARLALKLAAEADSNQRLSGDDAWLAKLSKGSDLGGDEDGGDSFDGGDTPNKATKKTKRGGGGGGGGDDDDNRPAPTASKRLRAELNSMLAQPLAPARRGFISAATIAEVAAQRRAGLAAVTPNNNNNNNNNNNSNLAAPNKKPLQTQSQPKKASKKKRRRG